MRNVRRALVGLGLGLAVLGPLLACSGATGDAADPAKDAPVAEPAPPAPPDPAKKIVGKWRMGIDEAQQRRYKVIDAALAKGEGKKEKLGDLSGEEQRLFDEWDAKDKKSPEVKAMRQEIRLTRGSRFTFTESSVSADFGGEDAFENIPYKVVSATDKQITLSFDPGLGNGQETHVITWSSDTAGVDNITGADGKTFLPLDILRLK